VLQARQRQASDLWITVPEDLNPGELAGTQRQYLHRLIKETGVETEGFKE